MPHLISAFGRETMAAIAIDEWMGASPVYSKRTQRALGFEGDSVETIFKNIQIDIGSPPQFMDFRFAITDRDHGEFWLDHCGALMDVEPMGEDFVHSMCHDIEDPTFDATATAANARAQVRPIHRPPRLPADRSPHCAWTVIIDESHPELPVPQQAEDMWQTALAQLVLDDIDPTDEGRSHYSDPMLDDLRFEDFSRSALVRIAQEVCIQWHLLSQAFRRSTRKFTETDEQVTDIFRKQFTGIAGLTAERLKAALGLGNDLDAVAQVLELHPAFLPRSYVDLSIELTDTLVARFAPGAGPTDDGDWVATLSRRPPRAPRCDRPCHRPTVPLRRGRRRRHGAVGRGRHGRPPIEGVRRGGADPLLDRFRLPLGRPRHAGRHRPGLTPFRPSGSVRRPPKRDRRRPRRPTPPTVQAG